MRRFDAPRPFCLLPGAPILGHCDAFVINFTAAECRAFDNGPVVKSVHYEPEDTGFDFDRVSRRTDEYVFNRMELSSAPARLAPCLREHLKPPARDVVITLVTTI
ncbi:hypothetical protein EVAR_38985_1 [Eumeta japonica]|uniref:Uncharacterized protein n=1 Tax=Eumeta variegata TaxID=151549 RepID=A0A4C1W8M6_EUMVA|nr:hypothetical protein EVAR_38985_1 [Eumeta japonica]